MKQNLRTLAAAAGSAAPEAAGVPAERQPVALLVEQIYRDCAPFVFRVLRALGVREADLPDVVHDVFLTVHRRRHDITIYSSTRAWVQGICVRTAANYRRHARSTREQLWADVPDAGAAGAEPGARLDLLRVLATLDEDQRAVFVLYEIEDLSIPEVAEALGCPASTAYSRLYAARKAIQARYQRARSSEGKP